MSKSKMFLSRDQFASGLTVITEHLKEFRRGRNEFLNTIGKKFPFPLPPMLMDDEILNPLKALKAEIDAVLAEEEKMKKENPGHKNTVEEIDKVLNAIFEDAISKNPNKPNKPQDV